jgi:enoyl-CoA hydratase
VVAVPWADRRVVCAVMPHVVTRTERDGVTVLAIDRPPANALDIAVLEDLTAALEGFAAQPPRALVLTGRPGFFSAGLDLKALPTYAPEETRRLFAGAGRMLLAAYGLPCPVVSAITGHAIAGGFLLALCGDHRIASTEGRYGLTEVKVALSFPAVAIGIAAAELSPHTARVLALSGRFAGADECVRAGAFDSAAPPEAVEDRALALAAELAAGDPDVYVRTKLQLRAAALERLRAADEPVRT